MSPRRIVPRQHLRHLAAVVADAVGVDRDVLLASQRDLALATERRQRALGVASYIATQLLDARAADVGEAFGGRNPSEIRVAVRALANDLEREPALTVFINEIAGTWQFTPVAMGPDELLDAAVAAAERALEAGLAADLRERLAPLLARSEEDR